MLAPSAQSRRRFKEAFESINTHFKEMFQTLFGGGVPIKKALDPNGILGRGNMFDESYL